MRVSLCNPRCLIPWLTLLVVCSAACAEGASRKASDGGASDGGASDGGASDGGASLDATHAPDASCADSDPTGAEGSIVREGCPCTRASDDWVCCPGSEESSVCDEGIWRRQSDGCNPPPCLEEDDAGGESCPAVQFTRVQCKR